uniref:Helitron helicase-like domain-containing protein n=1 Tax=Amphimedon queenslandica TaxID=400682 RepID=A0A1X7UC67_AMPQE
MSNPTKFPYGSGGYNTKRPRKIVLRKYYQQRLLDVDGRFSMDIEYILASQYIVENKQIKGAARNYIRRQKPSSNLTAREARNRAVISENVRNDKAYAFLKSVRGSPAYNKRTFYDLLAMVRQSGTPTWFLTLTAADMKWLDLISVIARQHGVTYTDKDINRLSFDDKFNWIRCNPVTAACHFQYRLHTFLMIF